MIKKYICENLNVAMIFCKVQIYFLNDSKHFEGRGACWSSGMGIRSNDKRVNYSHIPAQIKQQVS